MEMNNLISDTVDRIKRKAVSEMNKGVNENDIRVEKSDAMLRTRGICPTEEKEVKEEKNSRRDKI
jgi:hypothetical protein